MHFNHHITLKLIINSLVFHHSRVPLIRIMSSGINRTRRAIRAVRKTRMTRATRSTEAPEEIPLPPPLVTASTTGTIQVSKILSDTSTKNCQVVENTKTSLTSTFKKAPIHPFGTLYISVSYWLGILKWIFRNLSYYCLTKSYTMWDLWNPISHDLPTARFECVS